MTQPMLFTPLEIRGVHLQEPCRGGADASIFGGRRFRDRTRHLVNAGKYAQGGAGLVIMEDRHKVGGAMVAARLEIPGSGTTGSFRRWRGCAAFIKAHGAVAGIQHRSLRPQGAADPPLGRRHAAARRRARDLRLGRLGKLVAPSAVPHTERIAGAPGAVA